jgi:hypothetical protein
MEEAGFATDEDLVCILCRCCLVGFMMMNFLYFHSRDQFSDGRNCLKEDQTEYNYIITFISHIFTILFKDRTFMRYKWYGFDIT